MRRGCDWADRSDLHVFPGGVSTATLQVLARGTIVVESNNGTGVQRWAVLIEGAMVMMLG